MSQYLLIVIYILSTGKGKTIWQTPLYHYLPLLENIILNYNKHSKALRDKFKKHFITAFWENALHKRRFM